MSQSRLSEKNARTIAAKFITEHDKAGLLGGYCEPDFPFFFANEQMAKMLGYASVDELVQGIDGKVSRTIHPEDMAQVLKDLGPDLYEGLVYQTAYRMPRRDGTWFWTVDQGKVIRTDDGRLAIISRCSDMSDFLAQQRELEAENLFSTVMLDTMPGGYHRCDPTTEGYEFLYLSDRFLDILGWTRDEIRTRFDNKFVNLIHPDDIPLTVEYVNQISRSPKGTVHQDILYRLLGRDGWHWVTDATIFVETAKKPILQGFISDVTAFIAERDAREKELACALDRARRADVAKTDFLRRMSHDIRTPINGIRGMLEIASHYPEDLARQAECRQKIEQASGFLLSLVNNVLDMNKLESGTLVLEQKPFQLDDVLKEVGSVIQMQSVERGVAYASSYDITHRRLVGSATHLKQILLNIAGNAVKYTPSGHDVRITTREVSSSDGAATFEFICRDTGIGMSEAFQKQAFEPFSQETRTGGTQYAGTGLGLSIVKELVHLMKGTIRLESQPGVGTTFTITIPFALDASPEKKPRSPHAQGVKGASVLLVEDNLLNLEIAEFMLTEAGVNITTAANGQIAVDRFAASAPGEFDAILMDIMMPVMNGLEAARAIRALPRPDAATIPIIAMTANAFMDDMEQSRAAGMNEHLTKPLDAKRVIAALEELLPPHD